MHRFREHPISPYDCSTVTDAYYIRASLGIGAGINITCSTQADKSAILVLPDGAICEHLWNPEQYINSLTADMVIQWLESTRSTSLLLVTGYVKSRSWGVAAVSNTSSQGSVSLTLSATKVGGQFTGSYGWQTTSGGHHRSGPLTPSNKNNQCVFVRGYSVSSQKSRLRGKLGIKITDPISGQRLPVPKGGKRSVAAAPSEAQNSGSVLGGRGQQSLYASRDVRRQDEMEVDNEVLVEPLMEGQQSLEASADLWGQDEIEVDDEIFVEPLTEVSQVIIFTSFV